MTTTSPPGTRTVRVPLVAPAYESAATAAATVPVPQDRVSPTPRSCTRMLTAPSAGAVNTSTVTPSGDCSWAELNGGATFRAGRAPRPQPLERERRVDPGQVRIAHVDGHPPERMAVDDRLRWSEQVGLAHV